MSANENKTVKNVNDDLNYLKGDEAFKRKVELREKYLKDMASAVYNAQKKEFKDIEKNYK